MAPQPRGTVARPAAVPLRVDVLRHGRSEAAHPDGDPARRLTQAGREAIRALGARLAEEAWSPTRVFSSPYARARETAALVLEAAGRDREIEILAELEPECTPEDLAAALEAARQGATHVLLVGHQPL